MYHYVYEIHYSTGKKYIGARSCKCPPEEDTLYLGSSKHTPDDQVVRKIILGVFTSRKEAIAKEIELHNLYDVARNPMFYNQAKQTSTGFDTSGKHLVFTEEHKNKIRNALKGRKRPSEVIAKMSASKKGKPNRTIWTEEMRKHNSDVLKGRPNKYKGKTFSDEECTRLYRSRSKYPFPIYFININTGEEKYCTCKELANYLYPKEDKNRLAKVTNAVSQHNNVKSIAGWIVHPKDPHTELVSVHKFTRKRFLRKLIALGLTTQVEY